MTQYPETRSSLIATMLAVLVFVPTIGPVAGAIADVKAQVSQLRSEHFLPATTDVWISIPDARTFDDQFAKTQLGQLFKSDPLKPFVQNAEDELVKWLVKKDLAFGFDLFENTDWISGEICFAYSTKWVEPIGQNFLPRKIFLADVSDSVNEAQKKLEDAFVKLRKQGARQLAYNINGVVVVKTVLPPAMGKRVYFHAIFNGWFIITDRDQVLHDMLLNENLQQKQISKDALARRASFKKAMDRSFIPGMNSNLRWFFDPMGLMRISNQVRYGDRPEIVDHNRAVELLEKEGFDVFSGIGGNLCLATEDHELVHREYICTSVQGDKTKQVAQRRVLALFDFDNNNFTPLHPPGWIPSDAANCVVINWDVTKAFGNVGHFYDAMFEDPGGFSRMLKDFKVDPTLNLDLVEFFGSLDRQMVSVTHATNKKGGSRSSTVFAYQVKGDGKEILGPIVRMTKQKVFRHEISGFKVFEITELEEPEDPLAVEFGLPPDPVVEELEPKYYALAHGYLIVAQSMENIRRVLEVAKDKKLADSKDYQRVYRSLDKLTNPQNVSFRQFGRMDMSMASFYQSLRLGKLQWGDGLAQEVRFWVDMMAFSISFEFELPSLSEIAWLVVKDFFFRKPKEAGPTDAVDLPAKNGGKLKSETNLDGSKLPANFETAVAPFLGPAGWVLETEQDGWRITGCILKKQN